MTANFNRWESDPLFSAAEVVQDSADRMDSIFRMLLHEQSLVEGDPLDSKLLNSLEYHRRDLDTALGTTKWQLEDFERATNLSALSGRSHLREDAVLRHKQFIRAIREQIIQLEKSLGALSVGDPNRNMPRLSLNEQDRDGLALFLSGSDSTDHHVHDDSESSIMRRFLDSTASSGFDDKTDEIVELKTVENERSELNGVAQLDHSFDYLKENKLRNAGSHNAGSHYTTRMGFEASISLQESTRDKECDGSCNEFGACDLEVGDYNTKIFSSKNRSKGSRRKLDILGVLCKFWFISGSKLNRSFTKRRKDGELTDECVSDIERRTSSSAFELPNTEPGKYTWMGLTSSFSICQRVCFDCLPNTLQSYSLLGALRRRFQRSQYFVHYNGFPVRLTSAIFIMLVFLGLCAFHLARK